MRARWKQWWADEDNQFLAVPIGTAVLFVIVLAVWNWRY